MEKNVGGLLLGSNALTPVLPLTKVPNDDDDDNVSDLSPDPDFNPPDAGGIGSSNRRGRILWTPQKEEYLLRNYNHLRQSNWGSHGLKGKSWRRCAVRMSNEFQEEYDAKACRNKLNVLRYEYMAFIAVQNIRNTFLDSGNGSKEQEMALNQLFEKNNRAVKYKDCIFNHADLMRKILEMNGEGVELVPELDYLSEPMQQQTAGGQGGGPGGGGGQQAMAMQQQQMIPNSPHQQQQQYHPHQQQHHHLLVGMGPPQPSGHQPAASTTGGNASGRKRPRESMGSQQQQLSGQGQGPPPNSLQQHHLQQQQQAQQQMQAQHQQPLIADPASSTLQLPLPPSSYDGNGSGNSNKVYSQQELEHILGSIHDKLDEILAILHHQQAAGGGATIGVAAALTQAAAAAHHLTASVLAGSGSNSSHAAIAGQGQQQQAVQQLAATEAAATGEQQQHNNSNEMTYRLVLEELALPRYARYVSSNNGQLRDQLLTQLKDVRLATDFLLYPEAYRPSYLENLLYGGNSNNNTNAALAATVAAAGNHAANEAMAVTGSNNEGSASNNV